LRSFDQRCVQRYLEVNRRRCIGLTALPYRELVDGVGIEQAEAEPEDAIGHRGEVLVDHDKADAALQRLWQFLECEVVGGDDEVGFARQVQAGEISVTGAGGPEWALHAGCAGGLKDLLPSLWAGTW